MKRYLRHPVVHNALALYGIQFAEYVLPMITVPYLARVLLVKSYRRDIDITYSDYKKFQVNSRVIGAGQ